MNLLLIDLSSLAYPIWHQSGNDEPNATSTKTLARIRALASGQPHVAICLDSPPYFRTAIAPDYKAKRDKENNAAVSHQLAVAADTLRALADDIIAKRAPVSDIKEAADYLTRIATKKRAEAAKVLKRN